MSRGVHEFRERRRARRWQRWTEVEPLDDYARRVGLGAALAGVLFVGVIVLVIVGLVVAR
jgi:hypothetical protein